MSRGKKRKLKPKQARDAMRQRPPLRGFLSGVALIFDFTGSSTRRRLSTSRYPDDAARLAADWQAVGDDLRKVIGPQQTSQAR